MRRAKRRTESEELTEAAQLISELLETCPTHIHVARGFYSERRVNPTYRRAKQFLKNYPGSR